MAAEFDLATTLTDLAPELLSIGGSLFGASSASSTNDSLARNYISGIQSSAGTLSEGYDAQLSQIEQGSDYVRELLRAGLIDVTEAQKIAAQQYDARLQQNVGDFSSYVMPQLDEFGNLLTQADNQYGESLGQIEGQTANIYQQGQEGFADAYAPYTEGGEKAMQYLMQVMATNPESLTPSQRRMVEDYRRDAIARVAASGLRGSGRGGIAAVNEGDAALKAQFFDSNQGRADSAASSLAQYGYGSSGNVANNRVSTANNLADLRYKTGGLQTANTLQTQNTIADTGFRVSQDFANRMMDAKNKGASAVYDANSGVADQTGKYYNELQDLEAGRFQARADTSFGKAQTGAAATSAATGAQNQYDASSAGAKQAAYGQITGIISQAAKDEITKQST
jgi:hypothetical protein